MRKLRSTIVRLVLFGLALATLGEAAHGQQVGTVPALGQPGLSCVVSAVNRNAPVEPDGRFIIFGIPGNSGAIRARATCSDGSVGQTGLAFTSPAGDPRVELGDIVWGRIDPAPAALGLASSTNRLSTGDSAQLQATATALDGSSRDVTPRSEGTVYSVSNDLLATVSEGGQVTVLPLFAPGSSSRVVTSAVTEGGVAATYMFVLGPRGSLRGRVTRADGITGVANAQISVLRHQPMENAGTVVTNAAGNFELLDVNAGQFTLTAIDPATGDRGKAFAKIETEGQAATADVRMNGQGTVIVTVVDASNANVPNAEVTLTALGAYLDTRSAPTNGAGQITFERVMAGDFTVSTRDRPSGLIGTALGLLPVGGTINLTLRLQPVGTIKGVVYGLDGSSLQEGIQVRILSRERGIITQAVTGPDGAFSFNSLPLSDGPYTLDAFADGRLRARVPGIVLSTPNQVVTQNITLAAVGTVAGIVSDSSGQIYTNATVTLQMTEGLRLAFDAKTDANGRFNFVAVPVGDFTLSAAKDGRTGTSQGRVNSDNESVTLNVQLATNSLIGTVFQRDGVSPAVGVTVYLVPSRVSPVLTVDPNNPAVAKATTNGLGQFGFAIPGLDTYILQAESGLDRGRAQVVITTIDPAHPVQVNVAFLPKGTVTGVVKDSSGTPQPNAAVKVGSAGAFNNTWSATTDATGRYSVAGVFVGDITTFASTGATRLAGAASGRLLSEGQVLTLDVNLTATGRVSGQVLKKDGTVVAGPVRVDLTTGFTVINTLTLANGAAYLFDLVPVGDVAFVATELATNDKGVANTRISAASESKVLNVRLVGQGTVRVRTVDEAANPVADAKVTLKTDVPFRTDTLINTDAQGYATFQRVYSGDYTVSATKIATIGVRAGTAAGTLIAEQTQDVPITLTSRPVGTIQGVVFAPDGVTPRAGMTVRMLPEPSNYAYKTITDSEGRYAFGNIEGGTSYTISARNYDINGCNRDRVRAQVQGVQINAQDEVVVRDLQMIGAGKVSGRVVGAGGVGLAGIRVRLTNPDPIYGLNASCNGTFYETFSGADGAYSYTDIPAGNFTIIAENASLTIRGEGAGRVRFDGDEVTLDIDMVDSVVTMPRTLHDANAMPFDIAGDGSVRNGKNNIFTGSGPDVRGMRLEVVVNGAGVPFTNGDGTLGRLARENQEIQVDEQNLASGLRISRKVFVPRTGYFARYLEVLENRTENAVTIGLRVKSHHSASNSNPRVVDSSDGDQILSVLEGQNRDRWVIVDDQEDIDPFKSGSEPATGHIYDGENAPLQVGSAGYELIGSVGKLTWQWDGVTVPAGKTVILMHFAFNQLDRFRARQAALRLAKLPPEALVGLTTDEREAIVNFKVPADEANPIAPLPSVDAGIIRGRVVSGDGVTEIPNAEVHMKSKSVLFGRDYYVTADAEGRYEYSARADGTAQALAVPLFTFDIDAKHVRTGARTSNSEGDFVSPQTIAVKDLIFNGTGNVRGTVARHSGGLVEGANVRPCVENNERNCSGVNYDSTKADGTFLLSGNPPGEFFLFAYKLHPQQPPQGGEPINGRATTTVTPSNTTVTNIVMDPTGTLTGVIHAANGDPVEGARVDLFFIKGVQELSARTTLTDTAGRYRFFDVLAGGVRVNARDVVSGATGTATGVVAVDQEASVDVTLKGFGTLSVQVNFARGVAAPGASVSYTGERSGGFVSDAAGKGNASVPVGPWSLYATHPDDDSNVALRGVGNATLTTYGEVAQVTLTLKAAGTVKGTIVRPDGSTLADGFPYSVKLLNGSTSLPKQGRAAANGEYRVKGLPPGAYVITAFDPVLNRFADDEFAIAEDGQEVTVNLSLEDNRIALPADLQDANRLRFDVQQSGELKLGHSWAFDQSGLKLEVNGAAYIGDTSALLEIGKRQFAITQPQLMGGLRVTRKVFVPKGAYFARYLEVFENTTASAVPLEAKLTTRYAAAQLVESSSQGASLGTADRWAVLDDAIDEDVFIADEQQPPVAHVFAQSGAPKAIDEASFVRAGDGKGTLVQRWSGLSVPAGGKVVLMHFAAQQVNRAGAKASAERLAQLPPEAIAGLSESEILSIVNFSVPQDGVGVVEPLPPLTASLSGRVFEGDGVTAVRNVRVTVQSAHPLFNRVWGLQRDPFPCTMAGTAEASLRSATPTGTPPAPPDGTYSLQGRLTNTDSIALPEGVEVRVAAQESRGCFSREVGHPWTHVASREYRPTPSASIDVLFPTGILTGTVRGYNDFQTHAGRMYLSIENPDSPVNRYLPLNADGTYTYPGILPGTYDVLADVTIQDSRLRGATTNAVVTLAFTTVTDVQLQPAGGVQGAVVTANGEARPGSVVTLIGEAAGQSYDQCASGCVPETLGVNKGKRRVSRNTTTDSLGRYAFAAIPAGAYTLTVVDPVSHSINAVTLSVAEGQVVVQNVFLLGLGSVQLTAYLPNAQPAVDAFVHYHSEAQGTRPEDAVGITDAAGRFTIANVPQGNYTIRVRDPRRQDNRNFDRVATGTIATQGETQQKSVTFLAATTLNLTIVDGDRANAPLEGADVHLEDAHTVQRRIGTTNASGVVQAVAIPEGAFSVYVTRILDETSVAQTLAGAVVAADDGSQKTVTIALKRVVGSAMVTAFDVDNANAPLAGAAVYLQDSIRPGRVNVGSTDAAGKLFVKGIAVGPFTLTAMANLNGVWQEAAASGTITAANIGTTQDLPIAFTSALVPLQRTIYDANGMTYDVDPDGTIAFGRANFNGGASVLDVNGARFTGAPQGRLEAGTRQIVISQPGIGGLDVTRKVYVPRNGYFARYLEIFENRTASPVTLDAKLTHRYNSRGVVASSSGDAQPGLTDDWVTLDDANDVEDTLFNDAASAHVHGRAGVRNPIGEIAFGADAEGRNTSTASRKLVQSWNQISVPANGRVVLMHFVAQQALREGALESARRLVQLPPEALAFMTPADMADVVNFNIPADGSSPVAALPALTGVVSGRVFEGDGTTPVPGAVVTVKSANPLYGATRRDTTDTQGNYSIAGGIVEGQGAIAIPVDAAVTINSSHPWTLAKAPVATLGFPQGASTITRDLVYPTGWVTGRVIAPADHPLAGRGARVLATGNGASTESSVADDGRFTTRGLDAGSTYTLLATLPHHQGSSLSGVVTGVTVTAGTTTTTDVAIQPTGSITGAVTYSNGEPLANQRVELNGIAGTSANRSTQTGADGSFAFTAVPVGTIRLRTVDAAVQRTYTEQLSLAQGEAAVRNITLAGSGTIQLTVKRANGSPIAGVAVRLLSPPNPERDAGVSDAAGRLDMGANVGPFTVRATFPGQSGPAFTTSAEGAVTQHGSLTPFTIALKAVAQVRVTVVDRDNGNAPVEGALVTITDASGSQRSVGATNAAGQVTADNVPEGAFTANASKAGISGGISGSVNASVDGQVLPVTVSFTAQDDKLGTLTGTSEVHLYSVAATVGQTLSVTAYGEAIDASGALPVTFVSVYDPNNGLVARGYKYPGESGFAANLVGSVQSIPVNTAGFYTVAVHSYSGTGGYRLKVRVNAAPVAVSGYQNGGTVSGRVTRADGTTPAPDQLVAVWGWSPFAFWSEMRTDANGNYATPPMPLASYQVQVRTAGGAELASAGGALSTIGQNNVHDLRLPKVETVEFVVRYADGTPAPNASVVVQGSNPYFSNYLATDAQGRASTSVLGEGVVARVTHPQNVNLYVEPDFGSGPDGGVRTLEVALPPTGTVTGRVFLGGQPIAADVTVSHAGAVNTVSSTVASGYTLEYLPANQPITLAVRHPDNFNIRTEYIVTLPSHGQSLTQDFAFDPLAAIAGRVLNANGTPAAFVSVRFQWDAGGATGDTNGAGNYTVRGLPLGVSGFLVASNSVTGVETVLAMSSPASATTVNASDLVLSGHGTVTGKLTTHDGTPVASRYVLGEYLTADAGGNLRFQLALAAFDGRFTFSGSSALPVGRAIRLHSTDASGAVTQRMVTLTTHGEVQDVGNLAFPAPPTPASLVIEVKDPLGRTPPWTEVAVYDPRNMSWRGGGILYRDGVESLLVDNLSGVPAVLVVTYVNGSELPRHTVTLTEGQRSQLSIAVSLVQGTARHTDNEAVENLSVYAVQSTPQGDNYYYATVTGGAYEILGMPAGAFTLFADDVDSGLKQSQAATLVDANAALALDITMPPSGSVAGFVRRADGTPIPDIQVMLKPAGIDVNLYGYTDANGAYAIRHVPLVAVALEVFDSSIGYGTATGTLASDQQTINVDLILTTTVPVEGRVTRSSGAVVENAEVRVERVLVAPRLGFLESWGTTDDAGMYATSILPGDVRVIALDPNSTTLAGIGLYSAAEPGLANANAVIGNAVNLYYGEYRLLASGAALERYPTSCRGEIYEQLERIFVNGNDFPCTAGALRNAATGELSIGPFVLDDLRVERRILPVGSTGTFVRYLDTVRNESGAAKDVTIRIDNVTWNGVTASPDERFWIGHGYFANEPYVNHVFAGQGAVTLPVRADDESPGLRNTWTINVAAGGTVRILRFAIARGLNCSYTECNSTEAETLARSIVAGTEPRAFQGLTAAERGEIRNFTLP